MVWGVTLQTGGGLKYISLSLFGFRPEAANSQPLVRILLGDMFYFSCLGSKKIGISSNYLGIGILHINIWLAAFVRKIELSGNIGFTS